VLFLTLGRTASVLSFGCVSIICTSLLLCFCVPTLQFFTLLPCPVDISHSSSLLGFFGQPSIFDCFESEFPSFFFSSLRSPLRLSGDFRNPLSLLKLLGVPGGKILPTAARGFFPPARHPPFQLRMSFPPLIRFLLLVFLLTSSLFSVSHALTMPVF